MSPLEAGTWKHRAGIRNIQLSDYDNVVIILSALSAGFHTAAMTPLASRRRRVFTPAQWQSVIQTRDQREIPTRWNSRPHKAAYTSCDGRSLARMPAHFFRTLTGKDRSTEANR